MYKLVLNPNSLLACKTNINLNSTMKNILIYILILGSINCFSQEEYQLKVEVNSNMPFREYIIDLHKTKDNATIYFMRYTEDLEKMNTKDSLRIRTLYHKIDRKREDNQEIETLIDKYKIYQMDTIRLSHDSSILAFSDSITNSESEIQEEKSNYKNRIIIDGSLIRLNVKCSNDYNFRFFFNSPNNKVFSLIYNYLKEILDYYRSCSSTPILDKKYTGY